MRNLQQQRRFPRARFPSKQNQRARNQAASQHAIELRIVRGNPRNGLDRDIRQPGRFGFTAMRNGYFSGLGTLLLDKGIPAAAIRAAPQPFGGSVSAALAFEDGHRFAHILSLEFGDRYRSQNKNSLNQERP